ncbi:MAG: flagellar hook-basal body protein [Limisphaerales bacterium]
MLTSLSSAVSGLDAFQQQMDIIGNNIANLNTTGFKSANSNLADSFSNTLQAATVGSATNPGTNAMQIGTGVTTASITNDWTQGTINPTGVTSNLAINGNGFFVVLDPTSGAQYVTQDGSFTVNSSGNLVTATGMEVLGYNTSSNGTVSTGTTGPLSINISGSTSTAAMTGYTINSQGIITVTQADGTTSSCGQILLQNFTNPQGLTKVGNDMYSIQAGAGALAMDTPGSTTTGVGTIQSSALEMSNVDLSSQMANLITAQRGFEANSKIITTSDELLQDIVNLKH